MNPYEILQVTTKATAAQIKAAYRKLAKTAHPDHGGDPEEFRKLQLSFEVLSNPDRRKRYDQTGRTDESPVTPARVKNFIEQTMKHVVEAIRNDGSTDDPVFVNVRDKIIASILSTRANIKDNRHQTYKKIERTQRLIERFKPNAGWDPVGESLKMEKARLEQEMRTHEDALELSHEVERVFKTYGYEVGPEWEGRDHPGPTIHRGGSLRLTW